MVNNSIQYSEEKKDAFILALNDNRDYLGSEENNIKKIKSAYSLMEKMFKDKKRENGEDYFQHLRKVAYIILNEFSNPSYEKIIIAILHDSIEDIEEIDFEFLAKIFGEKVALSVQAISKKPLEEYLNTEELDIYKNEKKIEKIIKIEKKGKDRRNEEYFGHLESFDKMKEYIKALAEEKGIELSKEELEEIITNTLNVKFADRIHNLRTQWDPNNITKVNRKIKETEKYFYNIAKETNYKAYQILKSLIFYLRTQKIIINLSTDLIIKK